MKRLRKTQRQETAVSYNSLERREVLTNFLSISHVVAGNELFLRADPNSSRTIIEINDVGTDIIVSETRVGGGTEDTSFPAAGIDKVRYVGSGFRDVVFSHTETDTLISGRGGADHLESTSTGINIFHGGDGIDRLFSGSGEDLSLIHI